MPARQPDDLALDVPRPAPPSHGFRRFVLRGLGIVLPPLLTIVVILYFWSLIERWVLRPIESSVRSSVVWAISDTYSKIPEDAVRVNDGFLREGFDYQGKRYVPDPTGRRYLPATVVREVDDNADSLGMNTPPPASAQAYWHRWVQLRYMPRHRVVPIFLIVFTIALYFLGRIFTFGIGRWILTKFDAAILRIPLVNKVYGGVKQVTDFAFNERSIEFNNVVAIQYPREGMWSLGFATGTSLKQLSDITGEEMLSVLMPTSPMPMTGFTVTVRRCDAVDMNLTVDEAIQFIVSCGVVVPDDQKMPIAVERKPVAMVS